MKTLLNKNIPAQGSSLLTGRIPNTMPKKTKRQRRERKDESPELLTPAEMLAHEPKAKGIARILGDRKRKGDLKSNGKRWDLLESIKIAECTLGRDSVRLDHEAVKQAIEDAICHNDWEFLRALSRWHESRKPVTEDALSAFMWENWSKCQFDSGNVKGLQQLDDHGICALAKERGIRFRTEPEDFAGERAVERRRLKFNLSRNTPPKFTYRRKGGKLSLVKLAA